MSLERQKTLLRLRNSEYPNNQPQTSDLDLLEAGCRPCGENLRPIAGAVEAGNLVGKEFDEIPEEEAEDDLTFF